VVGLASASGLRLRRLSPPSSPSRFGGNCVDPVGAEPPNLPAASWLVTALTLKWHPTRPCVIPD
jgi:hypothetical protein